MKKIHLDFLVLGAQKSGTTSLHDWLIQQPEVSMPTIKETHFFSHADRASLGVDWYKKQFSKSKSITPIIGEIDPEYMFVEVAASKIKELTDVNKFIFILRDPLERAYSQYKMSVRRGYENLNFNDALHAEEGRLSSISEHAMNEYSYLARSMYSKQISRYKIFFPDAEFYFVKFDDLISPERGLATYHGICNFIGVKSSSKLANLCKISNQSSIPRSKLLRDILYQEGALRKIVGKLIFSQSAKLRIGLWLDKVNSKVVKAKRLRPQLIDLCFREVLQKEIVSIELITGIKFTDC